MGNECKIVYNGTVIVIIMVVIILLVVNNSNVYVLFNE